MSLVKPIIPHLWYDKQAKEAAEFYCSVFPDSRVESVVVLRNTPSGDCDLVNFKLGGLPFMAISAGPMFQFNPSISFMVNFDAAQDENAREHLDAAWAKLSDGGKVMMALDEYPFSAHYGWVQDRYGLSWQLMLANSDAEPRPFIRPVLMFTGKNAGSAEPAAEFYRSVFDDSRAGLMARWPEGSSPDRSGTVMFSDFQLDGDWFAAIDSFYDHGFTFNEAISFLVTCVDQPEIDRYWNSLSKVPESEMCGWCKDQYGLSWQISPLMMEDILRSGDEAKIARVTQAFLQMKKFDIATLEKAASQP